MSVRCDLLGRQGYVQRLRNVEARCRALYPLSLTNPKGLRTLHEDLPFNKVVTWEELTATRIASGVVCALAEAVSGANRCLADDKLGHGVRNPVKKWWLDSEMRMAMRPSPEGRKSTRFNLTTKSIRQSRNGLLSC